LWTARLKESGHATDPLLSALETSVAEEIEEAVQFAEAGTWEPVEDLLKDVYTR
jgi:pyruvate dehydrogenase E1 component alpha subunit